MTLYMVNCVTGATRSNYEESRLPFTPVNKRAPRSNEVPRIRRRPLSLIVGSWKELQLTFQLNVYLHFPAKFLIQMLFLKNLAYNDHSFQNLLNSPLSSIFKTNCPISMQNQFFSHSQQIDMIYHSLSVKLICVTICASGASQPIQEANSFIP